MNNEKKEVVRIQINGKVAALSDLDRLPAPYDVRVLFQENDTVMIIDVRYPSEL